MTNYKEIVTKAVIGKTKKAFTNNFDIECEQTPNTVLGCWVINHNFGGSNNNGKVIINGSYDVNVWYSYDNDTKTAVCTRKYSYSDVVNVHLKNDVKLDNKSEIIVECLKQPTVNEVKINGGKVNLKVDKEMGATIIGNTTVKVAIEDDFDDYDEDDEAVDTELDINVDELDDNYIEESVNK